MATQGKVDVELPGAPAGPADTMWPVKSDPWADKPNPWPGNAASENGGGRVSVPGGKDTDGRGPGSTGVTNTSVPI